MIHEHQQTFFFFFLLYVTVVKNSKFLSDKRYTHKQLLRQYDGLAVDSELPVMPLVWTVFVSNIFVLEMLRPSHHRLALVKLP